MASRIAVLITLLFSIVEYGLMDQALYDINNESSLCYDSDYGRLLCNDDCTKIVLCLGNQRDIIVENCLPNEYCFQPEIDIFQSPNQQDDLPKEILCSNLLNSCSNTTIYPILCHDIGPLPDPKNCHWYHLCSEPGQLSTPIQCQINYGFNSKTFRCSDKLTNNQCVGTPLLDCPEIGFLGVSEYNPNIWFVCMHDKRGLVHDIYRCDFNNNFDLDAKACPEWSDTM